MFNKDWYQSFFVCLAPIIRAYSTDTNLNSTAHHNNLYYPATIPVDTVYPRLTPTRNSPFNLHKPTTYLIQREKELYNQTVEEVINSKKIEKEDKENE